MTSLSTVAARPPTVAVRTVSTARVPRRAPLRINTRLIARADPKLSDQVAQAIEDAQEACEGDDTGNCATAWDEVEELSAAASHKKDASRMDPLDEYCDDNPDADECRIYED
mmetsp:Transcript_16951/g.30278  ORF Transcript_16951/g.30278 Transcript_16951/m.30278 type:complete len:112 (-) Transcript_16951:143-478(-)